MMSSDANETRDPQPQGKTPMERMDWAFRTVLKVPKEAPKDEERAKRPHSNF